MRLIVELMKYMMIFVLGIYTYYSFRVIRYKDKMMQEKLYHLLSVFIFLLHFVGYATLYLQLGTDKIIFLYCGEVLLFTMILFVYQRLYPKLSKLLLRNMLMLLSIGFIILTRLSYDKALRQVAITALASILCVIVPFLIRKMNWLKKFGWIYGSMAIILLLTLLFFGTTRFGATNWLNIYGFSFQPSELVKILYVLAIASLFEEGTEFKRVLTVTVLAGANVLILVVQRDLGAGLIFFVTYIFMLYTASGKRIYLLAGLAGGSGAAYVAYLLFDHVKVRVIAWQNPFSYIDREGYQIAQSLFAIGTGGWFGMGLNQGLPTSIPVVDSDFIYSAISEELGGLFALCILLIYINCFMLMINMSLNLSEAFHRQVALGFSVMFAFQVFLSIGGVIKFIPSTGVTLPLISYGGSSVFASILMLMILQGIYIRGNQDKRRSSAIGSDSGGGSQ